MPTDPLEEQRRLESRIARLEAELAERDSRLARLGQHWEHWLRLISHDFRGPLTLMLGYTQTVLHSLPDGPDWEEARRDLTTAIAATQRLDKMIGEIVDAARLEARLIVLEPVETELAPIVREAIRKSLRRYPGRIIRASIAHHLPNVETDARRAGQIISILISNAVVFSSEPSPVIVTARPELDRIVIAVEDHGIGLDDQEQSRIFEQFYRPERAREIRREGLGLGLFIADQLAMLLGGRVRATSRGPGQGSTFLFEIPIRLSSAVQTPNP